MIDEKVIHLRPQNHPELLEGEVFLFNATPQDFDSFIWETKRMGVKALDIHGRRVPNYVPVFAQRSEIEAKGYTFVEEK